MHQAQIIKIRKDNFCINDVSSSIIQTILYFDIFDYPVTLEEIINFSNYPLENYSTFISGTDSLIDSGLIEYDKGLYFLKGRKVNIERRINGNEKAEKFMEVAVRMTKLIKVFPFVKGVFISGSLSKGYMDDSSDIDYFIVTNPGRLWICRTLLMIFKKIFLLNSHKYFCINYLVSSESLEIADKNIYTATELITLIPVYNKDLFVKLLEKNLWIKNYFPNFRYDIKSQEEKKEVRVRKFFESFLNGKLGELLDKKLLNISMKHWRKKYSKSGTGFFKSHLYIDRNICKYHPHSVRTRILNEYKARIEVFEKNHNIKLCPESY